MDAGTFFSLVFSLITHEFFFLRLSVLPVFIFSISPCSSLCILCETPSLHGTVKACRPGEVQQTRLLARAWRLASGQQPDSRTLYDSLGVADRSDCHISSLTLVTDFTPELTLDQAG
ncbi:hypothetical protein ElyMa_007020700 [Elysia marginata]|uniref:J domain-containing protein n=1 Tax=Elysia marginata TaxID=1093978 RepID=A0AAV4JUZ0_9GAST|nr:hypothetical protein ElyMa_007020700 [Elysia marginata]